MLKIIVDQFFAFAFKIKEFNEASLDFLDDLIVGGRHLVTCWWADGGLAACKPFLADQNFKSLKQILSLFLIGGKN